MDDGHSSPTSILDRRLCDVALVVTAKRGLIVRAGVELQSDQVATIAQGTRCRANDERETQGKKRVRLVDPIEGWASSKCLKPEWVSSAQASGCVRWVVDILNWAPTETEFRFLLEFIPESTERDGVLQYAKSEDRKRALVSRLLIRRCASLSLNLDQLSSVHILRTKGRKPFLKASQKPDDRPNFNFNVSHEGRYVVLAAEPHCLCGMDVAAPEAYRKPLNLDSLKSTFTDREWAFVEERDTLPRFRALWACKEAFTKARGDGLGFPFRDAEFTLAYDAGGFGAVVAVDGIRLDDWRFRGVVLEEHVCVVARGPITSIVDGEGAFRRTLAAPVPAGALDAAWPAFDVLRPRDLVPPDRAAAFAAVGGAPPRPPAPEL